MLSVFLLRKVESLKFPIQIQLLTSTTHAVALFERRDRRRVRRQLEVVTRLLWACYRPLPRARGRPQSFVFCASRARTLFQCVRRSALPTVGSSGAVTAVAVAVSAVGRSSRQRRRSSTLRQLRRGVSRCRSRLCRACSSTRRDSIRTSFNKFTFRVRTIKTRVLFKIFKKNLLIDDIILLTTISLSDTLTMAARWHQRFTTCWGRFASRATPLSVHR